MPPAARAAHRLRGRDRCFSPSNHTTRCRCHDDVTPLLMPVSFLFRPAASVASERPRPRACAPRSPPRVNPLPASARMAGERFPPQCRWPASRLDAFGFHFCGCAGRDSVPPSSTDATRCWRSAAVRWPPRARPRLLFCLARTRHLSGGLRVASACWRSAAGCRGRPPWCGAMLVAPPPPMPPLFLLLLVVPPSLPHVGGFDFRVGPAVRGNRPARRSRSRPLWPLQLSPSRAPQSSRACHHVFFSARGCNALRV